MVNVCKFHYAHTYYSVYVIVYVCVKGRLIDHNSTGLKLAWPGW